MAATKMKHHLNVGEGEREPSNWCVKITSQFLSCRQLGTGWIAALCKKMRLHEYQCCSNPTLFPTSKLLNMLITHNSTTTHIQQSQIYNWHLTVVKVKWTQLQAETLCRRPCEQYITMSASEQNKCQIISCGCLTLVCAARFFIRCALLISMT